MVHIRFNNSRRLKCNRHINRIKRNPEQHEICEKERKNCKTMNKKKIVNVI